MAGGGAAGGKRKAREEADSGKLTKRAALGEITNNAGEYYRVLRKNCSLSSSTPPSLTPL